MINSYCGGINMKIDKILLSCSTEFIYMLYHKLLYLYDANPDIDIVNGDDGLIVINCDTYLPMNRYMYICIINYIYLCKKYGNYTNDNLYHIKYIKFYIKNKTK